MSRKIRPRAIKFTVQSKRGVSGRYRLAENVLSKTSTFINEQYPDAVKIERKLNNGLLAHEAEAAYARAKLYDKEIFRVRLTSAESTGWYY